MRSYDFKDVEKKWQRIWDEKQSFRAVDFSDKPKYYVLSEFFGPSGKGIHLGHVKCFTPSEVVARYKRLKGYNVLYPVGWDAFGLPTENYAIKMKMPPKEVTQNNIKIFTKQLNSLGFSFDWSREINTSAEEYYKWTQWIFLQLFKHKMAYKAQGVVNFCPNCRTVLSNEDSQDGICDRCKSEVVQERRDVWYLKMKDYSEKILDGIEKIDMKDSLKSAQRNWIGKSVGAEVSFGIKDAKSSLTVFTTRPDTLFGVTFMVIAPEHGLVDELKERIVNLAAVNEYRATAKRKTSLERKTNKDKSGVRLEGIVAINPVNNAEIPIFVSDYVMMDYGTGAIMAVPAHDERDYAFAKKHNVEIKEVISGGDIAEAAYIGDGKLVNSGFIDGLNVEQAKERIIAHLVKEGLGERRINYKMQDWPFNRQRYWGEPIPIIICDKCGYVPMDEKDLPLTLPEMQDLAPSDDGSGPLAKAEDWVNVKCPLCGCDAKRETDTMPNWAGSSWYWLRFLDPHNDKEFVSPDKLKYYGAVDLYTGGVEHVTRHMLYASFWHHFLYDIGAVPFEDPFVRRMCNGLILDENGQKMGKSSGNAVDPYVVVDEYGADVFRLHILFIGDYEKNSIWSFDGISGCVRFLDNVWRLQGIMTDENKISEKHEFSMHSLIKRCDEGMENFAFNTIIADLMKFLNIVREDGYITREELRVFLLLLNPMAPHITSEIFEAVFGGDISGQSFPAYDESKLTEAFVEMPIQVNGKLKGVVKIASDADETVAAKAATEALGISAVKKVIYVKGKIINIIV